MDPVTLRLPELLDEPLLKVIRESEKSASISIFPFNTLSHRLLQRMRRGKSGSAVRETVEKLRDAIPALTLRTSLIVGFPAKPTKTLRRC